MANLVSLGMLERLDGYLPVDKPSGIAFASVLKAVKRKFNLVKVGHGGAIDPAASGLFILLVGEANKFAGDIMGADRRYEGSMRLGRKTSTGDIHGEDISVRRVPDDTAGAIENAAALWRGDIFQTENRFCAVRREGSAGYELADTGEHKPFLAHVYRFDIAAPTGDVAKFSLHATKGVIVRTLIDDFGDSLGCGACLETLRRTKVGGVDVSDAVAFDRLLSTPPEGLPALVKPISSFFS